MTDGEFKSMVLPQYRQMYLTAFAILRNVDDASDTVQDVISSLWIKHDRLELPDNIAAFCNKTVRNSCIDRLRSNSKRYFDRIELLHMMASDTQTDSEASLNMTKSFITRILFRFKEKYRNILILNIFSQLSNEEISKITGETPENVRVILSRGRRYIKDYLKNEQ